MFVPIEFALVLQSKEQVKDVSMCAGCSILISNALRSKEARRIGWDCLILAQSTNPKSLHLPSAPTSQSPKLLSRATCAT